MKVLVCGGRDFNERDVINNVLDKLHVENTIRVLIHGDCATGADYWAGKWGNMQESVIWVWPCPARWEWDGSSAGPIRNHQMALLAEPNLVVAFPGGRGTHNMSNLALEFNIPLRKFDKLGVEVI